MKIKELAKLMRIYCKNWNRTNFFEWVVFRNNDTIILDCDFDKDEKVTRIRVFVNKEITTVIRGEVVVFAEEGCIKLASGNSTLETRIVIFD